MNVMDADEVAAFNNRMDIACELYGREFYDAYLALIAQDEADPEARMIVRQVWEAADPGKTLLSWYRTNASPTPTIH
jgi:hypothetical protein